MLVKNVYLMDGGTVIDQIQDLPQFLSFQYQNKPNDKILSVDSRLNGSQNGFYQTFGLKNNDDSEISSIEYEYTTSEVIFIF